MNIGHTRTGFDKAFQPAQWAGRYFDAGADANFRSEKNFEAGFETEENVAELFLEGVLVGNVEEIGDVIALVNFLALRGLELEEDVIGEEWFFEDSGFALIFLNAAIKGQGHFETLTFAVFSQFFLATRPGVSHVPEQISHRRDMIGKTYARASAKNIRTPTSICSGKQLSTILFAFGFLILNARDKGGV